MIHIIGIFYGRVIRLGEGAAVLLLQDNTLRRGVGKVLVISHQRVGVLGGQHRCIASDHGRTEEHIDKQKQQELGRKVECIPKSQPQAGSPRQTALLLGLLIFRFRYELLEVFRLFQFPVLDDAPVLHHDLPGGIGFHLFIVVGDHDDQLVSGKVVKDLQDLGRGLAVQISRGLVRHDDRRVLGKRPGDGDSLLLSSGQPGDPGPGILAHPYPLQDLHDPVLQVAALLSVHQKHQLDVLVNGIAVDQVVILKNVSNIFLSVFLVIFGTERTGILSGDEHLSLFISVQS